MKGCLVFIGPTSLTARCRFIFGCAVPALIACMLLSGCGHKREWNNDEVFPVTGKFLVDGQPLDKPWRPCVLAYDADKAATSVDDAGNPKKYPVATAWVKPDGSFAMSTYVQDDGMKPGNYVLCFEAGQMNLFTGATTGDMFQGQYRNPDTSEHKVSVEGGQPLDLGTIDLAAPAESN